MPMREPGSRTLWLSPRPGECNKAYRLPKPEIVSDLPPASSHSALVCAVPETSYHCEVFVYEAQSGKGPSIDALVVRWGSGYRVLQLSGTDHAGSPARRWGILVQRNITELKPKWYLSGCARVIPHKTESSVC